MTAAFGQFKNVLISESNSPEEPSICINPKNTNQIVAGTNIKNVHISNDGGKSWSTKWMASSYGVAGDPTIIADTAGNFYYLHLSNTSSSTGWLDRIVCQKQTDFSTNTWNDGSFMGFNGIKDQDKQWAVVDPATNTIYATWTQFDTYGSSIATDSSNILFSKSTDSGLSWSNFIRINQKGGDCIDSDNTTEGAVPAVGPNGEVYVCWSNQNKIWFDKSTDGGKTWLDNDVFVADQPGGWDYTIPGIYRCNGLPITVCDLSNSLNRGTIYVNWTDQRNGASNTDVWLCKSKDGGKTWSTPAKVNNDNTNTQQFFTWMTIDQTNGYLYFVFYDRRNYTDNRTDVYLAVSKDGGTTFENMLISESPFIPSNSVFFGDYNNISAHNGVVRPIWTRLSGGKLSVWTALIDFSTSTAEKAEICDPVLTYPNPTKESASISYTLKSNATIRLNLLSQDGKLIKTYLHQQQQKPDYYLVNIDFSSLGLANGTYLLEMTVNQEKIAKKIIFEK